MNNNTIMKKILFIAAILLSTLPAFAQLKSASLRASGLTCSMCSKAIFKALSKVPFVGKVDANIETSTYNIQFKPGAAVVLDDLKKAVENAGFSVAALQVTAQFPKTAIANDAHVTLGGTNLHFLNVKGQTLQGDQTFTVLDKNFIGTREHKKYGQYTKMSCYQTGTMAACCSTSGKPSGRIYHVTL